MPNGPVKIPEIDIYNMRYWEDPVWKKYFITNYDTEPDRRDFHKREMMRRKIAQKGLTRYIDDLTRFDSTNWEDESLPGGSGGDEWSRLRVGHETVENMFIHFRRLYQEDEE